MTVLEALHGVVTLPVAVHVRLIVCLYQIVVRPVDTTFPSLSVHV